MTVSVALFTTCLADAYTPRPLEATVRLLEHLGCEVSVPAAQTCCGQPFLNEAFPHHARRLARRFARTFESADYIISPGASCAAMVTSHYPELALPGRDEGLTACAAKTMELPRFLTEVLAFDPAERCRWPARVAVHRACHGRGLAGIDATPALLGAVGGLDVVPLPRGAQCCGFGGSFCDKYPDIADALGRDKLAAFAASGADWLVCNDAGCGLHLWRTASAQAPGATPPTKHLAEILAEGLGLLPRAPIVTAASP